MAATARVIRTDRFTVDVNDLRARAVSSFQQTQHRRRVRGLLDTAADAVMASGAIVTANAALHLGVGLPSGRNGVALGGALLAAGMAWITRHVRTGGHSTDPAATAPVPMLVPAWRDAEVQHIAA